MHELAHLKRLSAVKTNAGIKFLTPAASPGNHCPLHTALALSSNIKGMSTLVIGTAECGTYSRNVIAKSNSGETALHWVYVLDANEVVFGCRKGVIAAIQEMDAAGAKAITLILTCVPEVIGEDIEGVVHELAPKISARLNHVQAAHFKCNSHPSGFYKTLVSFASMMQPQPRDPKRINILGRSAHEDHIPKPVLLSALEQAGFQLRYLAPKSDMADFIAATDAQLNIVLSPYMNPLADQMQQQFQLPYISLHETYSVLQIDSLYAAIGDALGIALPAAVSALRETALALEAEVSRRLTGASYITTQRNTLLPLPLALYLDRFQMQPLLLHMEEFYPDDRTWAKQLTSQGQNPPLCHMVNEQTDALVLQKINPTFSFGELPMSIQDIPYVPHLYELYGQAGYERTCALLQRVLHATANIHIAESERRA